MIYSVYGLYNKADQTLLYIGVSYNLSRRETAHRSKPSPRLRRLTQSGVVFELRVLSQHDGYAAGHDEEKRLISLHKPVCNTFHVTPNKLAEPPKKIKRTAITDRYLLAASTA